MLADFFLDDSAMCRAQVEAIARAEIGADPVFVNKLRELDPLVGDLVNFVVKSSVSLELQKGSSRWRNMPVDAGLRGQWRKALRDEANHLPIHIFINLANISYF
jgi:hypothetical protein